MELNEEKKVGIPESITLNGVTYVVKDTPELLQFIQEVAKVEKSKLYTQFENMKSQIANLGKVKITENNEEHDTDALVEKLKSTFITKEDFKEVLPGIIKEVVQPVLNATEQNRQTELNNYREKLINENIATCIPELVKGETKEELDKSLQESIRIRTSYPTPSSVRVEATAPVKDPLIAAQAKEMETLQTPNQVVTTPMPPVAPRRHSPEVGTSQDVKQMSMSEFEKRRDSLKQQLESMYGSGM